MKHIRVMQVAAISAMAASLSIAPVASASDGVARASTPVGVTASSPPTDQSSFATGGWLYAAVATDYCSFSPDSFFKANFKPACERHDICYAPSSTTPRLTCDVRFRENLIAACNAAYASGSAMRTTCQGDAWVYYGAVRTAGKLFYKGKGSNA